MERWRISQTTEMKAFESDGMGGLTHYTEYIRVFEPPMWYFTHIWCVTFIIMFIIILDKHDNPGTTGFWTKSGIHSRARYSCEKCHAKLPEYFGSE